MLPILLLLSGGAASAAEVTSDDAKAVIAVAIQRGAPLYNQGSPDGCAAVYEVAALSLLGPGRDALSDRDRSLLEDTLSVLPPDADGRAWMLRRSFDAVLGVGPRPELPGAPSPVASVDAPSSADGVVVPLDGRWTEVDDRVMGGISVGQVGADAQTGHVVWTGTMTTASNGGFVTARTGFPALDLSGAAGLVLRVRGDGRTYKVTLNTDASHARGIGMARVRTVPGAWVDVRLPFSAFTGRMYGGTRPLDPTDVTSLQLQLSGAGQVGDYRLEIASVRAYAE